MEHEMNVVLCGDPSIIIKEFKLIIFVLDIFHWILFLVSFQFDFFQSEDGDHSRYTIVRSPASFKE